MEIEDKQRIIQEFVPGKQVTLAHVIANPTEDIYKKLGLVVENINAIGILTITLGFIDRFSGALVITGDVSSVEAAVRDILDVLEHNLKFTPTTITRT